MRDPFDRGSKWLIQHRGNAILWLAGARDVVSWRPRQAELVHPKQLPDGLLEVVFRGQKKPNLVVVEIATYPEQRIQEQVLRDVMLVYLAYGVVPEVLVLVLCQKGRQEVAPSASRVSAMGWADFRTNFRVVELWNQSADELLAAKEPGLIPWVPLTSFHETPAVVLQKCRAQIDKLAKPAEHDNLLAVTQVMTQLRYNEPSLLSILGGRAIMIQSPLIDELIAEAKQQTILEFLEARFGTVPSALADAVKTVDNELRLQRLTKEAALCNSLSAFKTALQAQKGKKSRS